MSGRSQFPPENTAPPGRPEGPLPDQGSGHAPRKRELGWVPPVVLVAVALLLLAARRILPPFVIAGVLAYIFSPVVTWMERRARIPRAPAVLLFLFLLLGPLAALIWAVEPALVRETRALAANTPDILRNLLVQLFGGESVEVLGQTLDANTMAAYLLASLVDTLGTPAEAFHVVATIVEWLLDAFLSLVLLFYFLLNPGPFAGAALRLVPVEHRAYWQRVGREIHVVMGRYVRGLAFLVLLMSAATWTGLFFIFHLPYSLPIAVATGFLEIIPFLGPVLAASIAAVVGLSHGGPSAALGIALFYLVLRQLEDQLVMPVVIGRAVELHPAVAIFAVLSGGAIAGVLGALLGIPVAAALKVAFDRWRPE